MLLHTIGSASDSGGSASANCHRGARATDAWHRPRAGAGGRLRDWYAICVESGRSRLQTPNRSDGSAD